MRGTESAEAGRILFLVDTTRRAILVYRLDVPYDLATAIYTTALDVGEAESPHRLRTCLGFGLQASGDARSAPTAGRTYSWVPKLRNQHTRFLGQPLWAFVRAESIVATTP